MTYQAKAADKAQQMITACQQALTIPKTNRDLHDPTVPYVDTVMTAKGAAWEAVIDCNIPKCNVGVVVRKYEDNSMRTQFEAWHVISKAEAIERMAEAMERNDHDMEGAARPGHEPNMNCSLCGERAEGEYYDDDGEVCNACIEKHGEPSIEKTQSLHDMLTHGVRNVEAMSHEQWDAIRRNLFAPSTDAEEGYMGSIEVIHYENETVLFLKDADIGGHVVASFGVYIRTPKEAAQMLADSVRNYTLNSLRYGDYGIDKA